MHCIFAHHSFREIHRLWPAETRQIRGTPAFTQLDYVATLWTRRNFQPNRDHALDVLADSWYHLLCDEG